MSRGRWITKVRYWRPTWKRGRQAAKVRYYGPGRDRHALAAVDKLTAKGYEVEIETAPIGRFVKAGWGQ